MHKGSPSSLNARIALELSRTPMVATDDENVHMDMEGCESESFSHSSGEHDEEEEDDDDGDVVVDDEEEEEEDDEEEAEAEPAAQEAPPSAAVKEVMQHVVAAKEHGDTAWFAKSMEPVWGSFPLMKGLAAVSHLGIVKEQPESAGNKSAISGLPATRWVCSPRSGGSKVYINFAADEAELVQLFCLLASFTRPTWRAYKDASVRDLAEMYNTALHIVQDIEYVS